MVEKISLDEVLLAANKRKAQRELRQPRFNLYELIKSRDSSPTGSLESVAVWNSIEDFLSISKTLKDTISGNGYLDDANKAKQEYSLVFATHAGARIALSQLDAFDSAERGLFNKHGIIFNKGEYCLHEDLLQTLARSIQQARTEHEILGITKDFYSWILYESRNASEEARFDTLNKKSKELYIEVKGVTINGFLLKDKDDVVYDADFSDIVGNSRMIAALRSGLEAILSYKPAEKTNVLSELCGFPQKFMIDGRPGTGKTHTLKALASYGQRIAEENLIDFRVINITNAIKSEFYSASARNLREQLSEIHKGDAIYLVVIEDIDTIFYSREELKNRPEDKSILGELMNQLEGITTSALGNYMIVCTTNAPLALDSALAERLSEKTLHATGPETEQDYVALFKIKLGKGIGNYVEVCDRDWIDVGAKCKEYHFSGRAIKNICLQIMEECNYFEKPGGWYGMAIGEQRSIAPKLFNRVCGKQILEKIELYHADGVRKEQQEHEEKVRELANHLRYEQEACLMQNGKAN